MTLRAVIFDYGEVLSGPPDPEAHRQIIATSGLPEDIFEKHYWAHRLDYDAGILNGRTYWQAVARDSGTVFNQEQISRLIALDVRMWINLNQEMLAWVRQVQEAGLRTAILSNMGEDVLARMRSDFLWLDRFDHLTWSCEIGLIKPDPKIYLHTVERLGVAPGEAIFLDNLQGNVEGAEAAGLHGLLFRDVAQLCRDLQQRDYGLPQPAAGCPA